MFTPLFAVAQTGSAVAVVLTIAVLVFLIILFGVVIPLPLWIAAIFLELKSK